MRTIWKYSVTDWSGELQMPRGAKILHVARQDNVAILWAEVDTDAEQVPRRVSVTGTGHRLPDEYGSHIATVMQGKYVWHLYIEDAPPTSGVLKGAENRSVTDDRLRAHLFDELQALENGCVESSADVVFSTARELLIFLRRVAS